MGLTRRDVDEWAAYSHGSAIASIDSGAFDDEIVPVDVTRPDGTTSVFDTDEHPRRGTTVEKLAALPVLHPEIDGRHRHRRQRRRPQRRRRRRHGDQRRLRRRARADPAGPHPVLGRGRDRAGPHRPGARRWPSRRRSTAPGSTLGDIDLFEINEAFCSVPVAAVRKLGLDPGRSSTSTAAARASATRSPPPAPAWS